MPWTHQLEELEEGLWAVKKLISMHLQTVQEEEEVVDKDTQGGISVKLSVTCVIRRGILVTIACSTYGTRAKAEDVKPSSMTKVSSMKK